MNARSIASVAFLALALSNAAHALGIVRTPSNVALGASLDFAVHVQISGDESLTASCISADVMQGDNRIAPSTIRIGIEPGNTPDERAVRVQSSVAIEEPVVAITLTLGCTNRLERRFTLFADPPLVTTVAEAPVARPLPPTAAAPTPAPRASAPAAARTDTADASAITPGANTTPRQGTRTATGRAAAPSPSASAPARRPARSAAATATPSGAPTAAAGARGGTVPRATPAAPARPRLQLDPIEPVARVAANAAEAASTQEAQLRVAAAAASAAIAEQAASAALANAAAAAERMRNLEQGVEKLRLDIERDREQLTALRTKLARAESTSRLAPWLGAGMALMAALALWLWLRSRRLQREQQAQWWAAAKAAQAKGPPVNPPTLHPMTLPPSMAPTPTVRPQPGLVAAPPAPVKPAFRDSLFSSQQEPRDVSIEELIDLEQQAEFFVVLGQDDAAIDLLMGHIRSSGGTSPLPYLKLLEIYRRQGDRESYERTRERFNHRFNAYAPDWDADLQHGRSLFEYPGVMQRLQAHWPEPLDTMAELEALMFKRDDGELFELPAYREVLFLYSMARDLLDHQGGPTTAIDVLLPLDKSYDFEPTTARPHLFTTPTGLAELGRMNEPSIEVLRATTPPDLPATPVDVDLTSPLPMHDDTVVFRRDDDDDQRSDFADLPPPKPKS